MTVKQVLARARQILAAHDIEDSPLESELLLRHTLGMSRVQLYLELDSEISPEEDGRFWRHIKRRLDHEPTAYITGHREFYGLDFYVDPNVLIPRPETELLVEKGLRLAQNQVPCTIAEIGTGCGAIAISLALNLPQAIIYATDISAPALKTALINCRRHGLADRIHLLEGDMLAPLSEPVDLVVANLPYVREAELPRINTFNFEPAQALNGGPDGLGEIRRLCAGIADKLRPGGYLLLEIGDGQGNPLTEFLDNTFPGAEIELTPDLSGMDRVVSLCLTPDFFDAKLNRIMPYQ